MLIVDDSRINLLKMKEKMLNLSVDNSSEVLKDYKELAIAIDREEYEALLEKIRKNDYTKLPLEEQISFLDEIEANYNSLNELEWGYKNTYSEYTDEELELSDISNILIDNITNRRSAIEGYLMNKKNLENNKIELDRLNSELIKLTKNQNVINDKISSINESLKLGLLKVEGRVYGPKNELIYTSITKEFEEIGLKLSELIDNPKALDKELDKAYKEKEDSEEMVEVAKLCYDDNEKNKIVYNSIKADAKENEYRLILLEIVHEICDDTIDYDLVVNKLYRVLNLIEERRLYLKDRFYIDPFDRLRIPEYIDELNSLGNNDEAIDNVKKTITYMISSISNMEEMNDEFVDKINEHCAIILGDEFENVAIVDDYIEEKVDMPTQVIKIDELPEDFMLERAIEKADNVITRVNKLFNVNVVKEDNLVTPDLIIDNINEEVEEENIFNEEIKEPEVKKETNEEIFASEPEVFEEVLPVETKEEVKIENPEIFVEETPNNTNNDLFEDTKPFEEVQLFSDRYDDEVFGERSTKGEEVVSQPEELTVPSIEPVADVIPPVIEPVKEVIPTIPEPVISEIPVTVPETNLEPVPDKQDEVMPDAFWTVQEKDELTQPESYENNAISFDQQIEALIGADNLSNTRKK